MTVSTEAPVGGLLGPTPWHGNIALGGWHAGSGADYAVIEPATGDELGRIFEEAGLPCGVLSVLPGDDVDDLDHAASVGAWGSFFHQGQICIDQVAAGGHLVDARIADEYAQRLAERANRLPVGDPTTQEVALGPIIDARQRDAIDSVVHSSIDAGTRLAAGGTFDGLF